LEGLQGLERRVVEDNFAVHPSEKISTRQRTQYQAAAHNLTIPAFMIQDVEGWRLVHYEADILSRLPWNEVNLSPLDDLILGEGNGEDARLTANLSNKSPEFDLKTIINNIQKSKRLITN